jgi:putative transcriptional regulator
MTNKVLIYRKRLKITQEELAHRVGVTRQTIISIESGKYVASLTLALKLAKIFGKPVEEIFALEEDELNGI